MTKIATILKRTCFHMLVALTVGSGPAMAEDVVTLKFGSSLPAAHYVTDHLIKEFFDGVEQASGGEIKFEFYPAAQLGKDTSGLMKSGLLDIGLVIPGLFAEKFPLSSVVELPQIAGTSCEGTAKAWAMLKPGGELDRLEYKPAGIRALSAHLLSPYVLHTRGKKIEKLADVGGIKLWVSGAAQQETVSEMGGIPIRIPSPELYDAASRGTIDGALFPYAGIAQYEMGSILNSAVKGVTFGAGLFFIGMTENRWEALPEKQRNVLAEQANKAQASFCAWVDRNEAQIRDKIASAPGYTVSELSAEAHDEFATALNKVGDEWAAGMDARGKQGSTVLKALRALPAQ